MSTIKGQNLRLFIEDDTVIAAATSCQLHVGTEFQDVSTKDDANPEWQSQELSRLNWDVQADALVETESSDKYLQSDFGTALKNEDSLGVVFGNTDGTMYYSGLVKVTDISIQAQVGSYATYTVQMQGIGQLSIVDTPSTASETE